MIQEQAARLQLMRAMLMTGVQGDGEGGATVTLKTVKMEGLAAVNAIVVEGILDAAMTWV